MSKIHLGIVGAGFIANEHLKVIKKIKVFRIIGITSRTNKNSYYLAKKYNIDKVYKNYKDMAKNNKIDAFLVLVSADQVFNVLNNLISFKKPFFAEKPPGLNADQTLKLSAKCKKFGTLNMIGFNRRYYSIFHKGLKIINKHGKLLGISIEGHERFWKIAKKLNNKIRNSWIYANSTHTVDLLRFFAGNAKLIKTIKSTYLEKKGDQFSAIIKFKNGIIGNYFSHWYSPGGWSVKLYGEGVTVQFKPLEVGIWIDKNLKKHKILPHDQDLKYKAGFFQQMLAFKTFLQEKKHQWPAQDLKESYETMKLAKKIFSD